MTQSSSRAHASRPLADWLWGALGLSLAGCSASFAAYMVVTAPAEVTGWGSNEFRIFVNWDRRTRVADQAETARTPAGGDAPRGSEPPEPVKTAVAIDSEPTGSIPGSAAVAAGGSSSVPRQPTAGIATLPDYVLRDVVGGKALIEHRNTLSLVKPGTLLEGAGRVLSIERRGDLWVVHTASGIIGGQ